MARLTELTAHENIEGATASHTAISGPFASSEAVSSLALMDNFIEYILYMCVCVCVSQWLNTVVL